MWPYDLYLSKRSRGPKKKTTKSTKVSDSDSRLFFLFSGKGFKDLFWTSPSPSSFVKNSKTPERVHHTAIGKEHFARSTQNNNNTTSNNNNNNNTCARVNGPTAIR